MISSIKLQNFRLYKDSQYSFDSSVNIIVGPNTCGKTSLLEAILVITKGSSYRVKDSDLIRFGQKWLKIEAKIDGHERAVNIRNEDNITKQYSIDEKIYKRLNIDQIVPVVLFEPNDLLILTNSPESRRNYLDNLLINSVSGYKTILAKFNRALSQRNNLLKSINQKDADKLFPWNVRLSQLAGQIVEIRSQLIVKLNTQFPKIYSELSSSKVKTDISYITHVDLRNYETKYLDKLHHNINEDMALGFTGYGPHRDDFLLSFASHPINVYASRGEVRTAALALKLTEHKILSEQTGKDPIFLLDDVFGELDSSRRHALAAYLMDHQSFITTTDADIASKQFRKHRKILPLKQVSY